MVDDNRVVEILQGTRERVLKGWTKGSYELKKGGQPVCHCLLGALYRSSDLYWTGIGSTPEYRKARTLLESMIPRTREMPFKGLISFNDHYATTKEDVIATIDRALEKATQP